MSTFARFLNGSPIGYSLLVDDIELNAGTGGAVIAADDISSVWYQRVKLTDGTADSTTPVNVGNGVAANALRVTLASDSTGVVSVDDNGGALTVDGTVTANLSATDNAVLDTIETNTDFGTVVGGGVEATALRVTLASDSTGQVTVDGTVTANLSATDNAVLDNIQTAVELIDNAIAGTEMQVDVVAALPAGTNNIGDVDVLSVIPGTAATNLGKAEDAVHASGDTGVMPLAVRNDDLAALAGTDGDYAPLQVDEAGALYVNPAGSGDIGRAIIDAATSGDNTLVAAAGAGVRIRVTSYVIVASAAVTVRFEDGAAGTALTGQMQLAANGGVSAPFNPHGYFETTANTLLNLELSAAVSVDGHLTYVLVP